VVVKERDRQRLAPASTVVIPNGTEIPGAAREPFERDGRQVVFVGFLHYVPNRDGVLWFVREVLPILETLRPEVEVRLIGEASDDVRALGHDPRVRVDGYVEDLDRALAQAAVAIVPLRMGSGTRLKVLEAFARGLPVVSTSVGCDGLDVADGEHLLIADSPADFARACASILGGPDLAAGLASRAEHLVRERYDWAIIERQIGALAREQAARRFDNPAGRAEASAHGRPMLQEIASPLRGSR
jgi:glycosyltransferase involved in cell wall biosynthesis